MASASVVFGPSATITARSRSATATSPLVTAAAVGGPAGFARVTCSV